MTNPALGNTLHSMRLPPWELLVAVAGLIAGAFAYVKQKKRIFWMWIAIALLCFGALTVSMLVPDEKRTSAATGTAVTTHGNTSPAINQTGTGTNVVNQSVIAGSNATINSVGGNATFNQTTIDQSQIDYIPNTKFTHSQMREFFPFGYTIFWKTGDILQYKISHNERLNIAINWDKIRIGLDFQNKEVIWHIPEMRLAFDGKNIGDFGTITTGSPMEIGKLRECGAFIMHGQPAIHFMTLSTDQRFTVVALGFRYPERRTKR